MFDKKRLDKYKAVLYLADNLETERTAMIKVRVRPDILDELLTRANITRKDFAGRIGVHTAHLSQLLKGDKFPSPKLRAKIQAALISKTFDELFEIVEDKSDDN